MSEATLAGDSLEAVQEHIVAALEKGEALEVVAGGSKRSYGRDVRAASKQVISVLDVSGLTGIVDYQPNELILVARPGTPLAGLEATLADQGQQFAFEPPHFGEAATLGGALACNLSGPRRFKAGAARDHLLGFQAVTGRGEVVRGGGRVVKNVTGYDLSKLMCGSFGTLAVLTEVVVKVLPRAESERTVLFAGLSDAHGAARLIAASRTPHEPSGLAHLPSGAVLDGPGLEAAAAAASPNGAALTAMRVEGPAASAQARAELLVKEIQGGGNGASGPAHGGAVTILEEGDSRAFWAAVRELTPLPVKEGETLWRFSVAPTAGVALGESLRGAGALRLTYDWGGALVWAVFPGHPAGVHALAFRAGGHAQRVRQGPTAALKTTGDGTGKATVDGTKDGTENSTEDDIVVNSAEGTAEASKNAGAPFTELSPGQHRLNLNLKLAFDPARVLNPGRMYADI